MIRNGISLVSHCIESKYMFEVLVLHDILMFFVTSLVGSMWCNMSITGTWLQGRGCRLPNFSLCQRGGNSPNLHVFGGEITEGVI